MTHPVYHPIYNSNDLYAFKGNDIFVLKTNVVTNDDLEKMASVLSEEYRIKKWSVDMFDIDKVLRIESQQLKLSEILELTRQAGYYCEELPD